MIRPWHQANPELFETVKREVCAAYPTLHFFEQGDRVRIKGSFPLVDEGRVLDRYKIEVELPQDYPQTLPIVWEIGGRIPRKADRHVNEADGTLCVCLPDAQWAANPTAPTFLGFLEGPVRNYLLGNSLVERGDPWPFGEWGHGEKGTLDFYRDLLKTADRTIIVAYLSCLSGPVPKGHWLCPCGSGKKLRACHLQFVRDLRSRIPANVARVALNKLHRS